MQGKPEKQKPASQTPPQRGSMVVIADLFSLVDDGSGGKTLKRTNSLAIDDRLFVLLDAAGIPTKYKTATNFQRICLHSPEATQQALRVGASVQSNSASGENSAADCEGQAPRLVLDSISDGANDSQLVVKGKTAELTCTIRCLLTNPGYVRLWSILAVSKSGKDWVFDQFAFYYVTRPGVASSRLGLKEFIEKLATTPILMAASGEPGGGRSFVLWRVEFDYQQLDLSVSISEDPAGPGIYFPSFHRKAKPFNSLDEYGLGIKLDYGGDIEATQYCSKLPNSGHGPETVDRLVLIDGIESNVFETNWNERVAAPYHKGLRYLESGRPVSVLPLLKSISNSTQKWILRFAVEDFRQKGLDPIAKEDFSGPSDGDMPSRFFRLFVQSFQLNAKSQFNAIAELPEFVDQLGHRLKFQCVVKGWTTPEDARGFAFELAARNADHDGADSAAPVRLGAVDLDLGRQPGFSLFRVSVNFEQDLFAEPEKKLGRWMPEVEIDARFPLQDFLPGGQDDVPGEEYVPEGTGIGTDPIEGRIEKDFQREVPIVILWNRTTEKKDPSQFFELRVDESTRLGRSQTVRMNVYPPEKKSPLPEYVVVMDRNPFLVALVKFPGLNTSNGETSTIIANWQNGGIDGANWQLRGGTDPFDLFLPPQAVGEAMEKGLDKNTTVQEGQPLPYRFGPRADFELFPSYFKQLYAEAPWNLRRVLGYPGQRSPGSEIKHLQYELIYGLSCEVSHPFLRLAEIFSLVGDIPGRLQPKIAWQYPPTDVSLYNRWRENWAQVYSRYLTRLALFEPWDSHQPGELVLNDGISCQIRDSDLKRPVPIKESLPDGTFEGGVTWGFESPAVYNAVISNPQSTSAKLAHPAFSSLGGYGYQKAGFDKDRSSIYANVEAGRSYDYTIERIGRIGVFWNVAKHVIVYERTVLPSRQFYLKQSRLERRAILRKVREYIEILQPNREYPEFAAAPITRGFVKSCNFSAIQINVDSDWGSDIGDSGWQVPLWNPQAQPSDVYPKPSISLGLLTNEGDKQVAVQSEFAEPQNLYFYTSTSKQTGGDPNSWPAVPGIDYVDLPNPTGRKNAFQNGHFRSSVPADVDVPPGFERVTFRMSPSPQSTNLVADRFQASVGTKLSTVTMSRATPNRNPSASSDPANAAFANLTSLETQCSEAFSAVLGKLPDQSTMLTASVSELVTAFTNAPAAIQSSLKQITDAVADQVEKFVQGAIQQETAAIDGFTARVENQYEDLLTQFQDFASRRSGSLTEEFASFLVPLNNDVEDWKKPKYLIEAINSSFAYLRTLLSQRHGRPEVMQGLVESAYQSIAVLPNGLKDVQQYVEELSSLDKLTKDEIDQIVAKLNAVVGQANKIKANLGVVAQDIQNVVRAAKQPWMLIDSGQFQDLVKDVDIQGFVDNVTGILTAIQNQSSYPVKDVLDRLKGVKTPVGDTFKSLVVSVVDSKIESLRQTLVDEARSQLQVQNITFDALSDWLAHKILEKNVPIVIDISGIKSAIVANATALLQTIRLDPDTSAITNAISQALSLLQNISQQNQITVDALYAKLNELRDGALASVQELVGDAAAAIPHLPVQLAQDTLQLVRAFGEPPQLPNLSFYSGLATNPLSGIAYFFDPSVAAVDMSPVLSKMRDLDTAAQKVLNPLGIQLPTRQLADRFVPDALQNFDLNRILPDFSGLKLANLFPGLKMPDVSNDRVKVTHGFDQQAKRGWVEANVDVPIAGSEVFAIGPVHLRLDTGNFGAVSRIEASADGTVQHKTNGSIVGDWSLRIGDTEFIIFESTQLLFDDRGGIRFNVSPSRIKLAAALDFVQEMISGLDMGDSGFAVAPFAGGVECKLDLPFPDLQAGTSGISNLSLGARLALALVPEFSIQVGFSLAKREAPFALTIFILGGGGFADCSTTYIPSTGKLICQAEVGITANASLAISLGPISGGVAIHFGVEASFRTGDQEKPLTIGILLVISGHVSVLGIVSAWVALTLEGLYSGGRLIGHGHLSIHIKICWCFTLNVDQDVQYSLGGSGGSAVGQLQKEHIVLAMNDSISLDSGPPAVVFAAEATDHDYAADYVYMTS